MAKSAIVNAIEASGGAVAAAFGDVINPASSASLSTTSSVVLSSSAIDRLASLTNTGSKDAFLAFDEDAVMNQGVVIVATRDRTLIVPAGVVLNGIVGTGTTNIAIQTVDKA